MVVSAMTIVFMARSDGGCVIINITRARDGNNITINVTSGLIDDDNFTMNVVSSEIRNGCCVKQNVTSGGDGWLQL